MAKAMKAQSAGVRSIVRKFAALLVSVVSVVFSFAVVGTIFIDPQISLLILGVASSLVGVWFMFIVAEGVWKGDWQPGFTRVRKIVWMVKNPMISLGRGNVLLMGLSLVAWMPLYVIPSPEYVQSRTELFIPVVVILWLSIISIANFDLPAVVTPLEIILFLPRLVRRHGPRLIQSLKAAAPKVEQQRPAQLEPRPEAKKPNGTERPEQRTPLKPNGNGDKQVQRPVPRKLPVQQEEDAPDLDGFLGTPPVSKVATGQLPVAKVLEVLRKLRAAGILKFDVLKGGNLNLGEAFAKVAMSCTRENDPRPLSDFEKVYAELDSAAQQRLQDFASAQSV